MNRRFCALCLFFCKPTGLFNKGDYKMKKIIAILLAAVLVLGFVGCAKKDSTTTAATETAKATQEAGINIVCTIFPQYDFMRAITKGVEGVNLKMLLAPGDESHSYSATLEDISAIDSADLFIYVGGESDKWVGKALQEGGNPKRKVISLMRLMGNRAKVEEEVEGMEKHEHHEHDKDGKVRHDKDKHDEKHEHEKEHDKDKHDGKEHHEQPEYDEHVWLSLKNADLICKAIAEELAALDSKNAETYRANYAAYSKKLAALDAKYKEAVTKTPVKAVLFGDRFPFRYLTDDYGLKYYAAFNGCSAETEASFATVAFLAKKTDELKLPAVLTIEGRQHKLAQTIVDNTKAKNQKVLTLNSMQATTEEEIKKGITYLTVMERNLKVLQEAL